MAVFSEEQIIKTLRKYNPWWADAKGARTMSKAFKRHIFHTVMEQMRRADLRRFTVLSGMRRVGKTTILYQCIDRLIEEGTNPRNILFVSFDNPIFKFVTIDDILNLYETLYPLEGMRYLFFDETQYADDWELWLKVIYDTRKDVYVVATGSASPILEKGGTDSGTGRWRMLKVPTLSFYEYCALLGLPSVNISEIGLSDLLVMNEKELADISFGFSQLLNHFNRYLTIGGFPELALSSDDNLAQRLLREDVVDKVLKRDVLMLFKIRNPQLIEKLFVYLCMNASDIFNATTASKEIGNVSVSTIEQYIEALEMSNLIYKSEPVNVGSKGSLKGKPKIYPADAAIRNSVLLIDNVTDDERELGFTVETTVYKHIFTYFRDSVEQIGYFRNSRDNQKEVDIVVADKREQTLIEVKYRNNTNIPTSDAIVNLCMDTNNDVTNAVLVTKRLEDVGKLDRNTKIPIVKIPAAMLLYVIG